MNTLIRIFAILGLATVAMWTGHAAPPLVTLLNVSYDPTRELYRDYNALLGRDCDFERHAIQCGRDH